MRIRMLVAAVLMCASAAPAEAGSGTASAVRLEPGDILATDHYPGGRGLHHVDAATGVRSWYSPGGLLVSPTGVAFEPGGDIVVTDRGRFDEGVQVVRIDRTSEAQTRVSSGGLLNRPSGVAVMADGTILVADSTGLIEIDPRTGAQSLLSAGATRGVTVGPAGDILVTRGESIVRIDRATGAATTVNTGGVLSVPYGLAVEPDGDIVVADPGIGSVMAQIVRVNPATGAQTVVTARGLLTRPVGVAIEADGRIVVADYGPGDAGGALFRVDPDTGQQTLIGDALGIDQLSGVALVPDRQPVAAGDGYRVDEDARLEVAAPGVLGNDSDPDGEALTAELVTGPSHGTLSLRPDGSFGYVPVADFHGSDSFRYVVRAGRLVSSPVIVTITVVPVNDAPVAAADRYRTSTLATLAVVPPGVLGNDRDPDGEALTAELVTGPSHGTLSLRPDGSFSYRPHLLFLGEDGFTYRARDRSGAVSAPTRVTITVGLLG